jgi:hypothetical protein
VRLRFGAVHGPESFSQLIAARPGLCVRAASCVSANRACGVFAHWHPWFTAIVADRSIHCARFAFAAVKSGVMGRLTVWAKETGMRRDGDATAFELRSTTRAWPYLTPPLTG